MSNEVWRLARKPLAGWPVADDFRWQLEDMPEPALGQMLTRTIQIIIFLLFITALLKIIKKLEPHLKL